MESKKLSEVPPGRYFGLRQARGTLNELYIVDPYNNMCTVKDGKYEKFTSNSKQFNLAFQPFTPLEMPWPHAKGAILSGDDTLPLPDGTLVQGYLSGLIYEIKDRKLEPREATSPRTATGTIHEKYDSFNVIDPAVTAAYMYEDGCTLQDALKLGEYAWRFTNTGSRMYVNKAGRAVTYRNGHVRWVSTTTIKQGGWMTTANVPQVVKGLFEEVARTLEDAQTLNPESTGFISGSGVAVIKSIGVPVCFINGITKYALTARPYTEELGWKPYNSWYRSLVPGTIQELRERERDGGCIEGLIGVYHGGEKIYANVISGSAYRISQSQDGTAKAEIYYGRIPEEGWVHCHSNIDFPTDPHSFTNAAIKSGWSQAGAYVFCAATHKTYGVTEDSQLQMLKSQIGLRWEDRGLPVWYGCSWDRPGDAEIYSNPGDGLFYALKSTGGVEKRFAAYMSENKNYRQGVPDWFERYKKFGRVKIEKALNTVVDMAVSTGPEVKVPPAPDTKIAGNFTPDQMIQLIGDLKSLVEMLLKAGQKEQAEKVTERIIYLAGSISWSMR